MSTASLGDLLRHMSSRFTAVGIDTARLDARLLAAHVLGVNPAWVASHLDMVPTGPQAACLEQLALRRENREPVSHLLGWRGFWTLDLRVTRDTLDPRPDTETLVQAVLDRVPDRLAPLSIVDFGTGTGAILLALLSELPNARGLGVDKSPAALAVAADNALSCGMDERVRFEEGDWGMGIAGPFDVVVSNPPYIPDGDIDGLEPEVSRYEPRLALAGGADGLDCYRALLPHLARLVTPHGIVGVEVGQGQDVQVAALFDLYGLKKSRSVPDLAGISRCVIWCGLDEI